MILSKRQQFIVIASTGMGALIGDICSGVLRYPITLIFGHMWMSHIRHALIDAGMPSVLVTRYIAFALLDLPFWIVVALVALWFGFSQRSWTTSAAFALAFWMPVVNFLTPLCLYPFYSHIRDNLSLLLFSPNVRIVSLLGTIFTLAGWSIGYLLYAQFGRKDDIAVEQTDQDRLAGNGPASGLS